MPTIKFHTLGCKVNQYDTQSIRENFLSHGFREAGKNEVVGFCLVNTCTVTSSADQKSRGIIRKCIKENPGSVIIVTGCMVEKDWSNLAEIKGVSHIIGKGFFKEGVSGFCGHTRAFLKIQDGCNNFCSYCKVPLVRGRSRSKPFQALTTEAKSLVDAGFKEIVLTGICLGAYGRDFKGKVDLVNAITALERINGLLRIRLSSIEAGDVTGRLIKKMASSNKLCPHLHIPIQSGDDEILKKMGRRYSRSFYLNLIRKIKKTIPGVSITTDCLVGFPGEMEKNFRNTVDLIQRIKPLKTHIFPYSSRKGTVAGSYKDSNNPESISERCRRLKIVADSCSLSFKRLFKGKRLDVLIEGKAKQSSYWQGYSGNYIRILVKTGTDLKNKIVSLKLEEIKGDFAIGEMI